MKIKKAEREYLFILLKGSWSEHCGWPGSWRQHQKFLENLFVKGLVDKKMVITGAYYHPEYTINDAGKTALMNNPMIKATHHTVVFKII